MKPNENQPNKSDEFQPVETQQPPEGHSDKVVPTPLKIRPRHDQQQLQQLKKIIQSVRTSFLQDHTKEDLQDRRHQLEKSSAEGLRNILITTCRTHELEKKIKKLTEYTAKLGDAYLKCLEQLVQQKKLIEKQELQLHQWQQQDPDQLSAREKITRQQETTKIKAALQPYEELKAKTLQLFDHFAARRYQELSEESSLNHSLKEYLNFVDPRIRARLETQIYSKAQHMPYEKRITAFQQLINTLIQTTPEIAQIESERLLHIAQDFIKQNNISAAIENLQQALEYDIRNGKVYIQLAECWGLKEQPEKQKAVLLEGVKQNPEDLVCRLVLARFLEDQQDYSQAIYHYLHAHEQAPMRFTLLTHLAKLAYEQQQWQIAIPLLNKILERRPQSLKTRQRLGIALVKDGFEKEGLEVLNSAIKRKDNDPKIHYYMGLALKNLNQFDEGVNEILLAHEQLPDDFDISLSLAEIYHDIGDYESCVKQCQLLLQIQSDHQTVITQMARAYKELGDVQEAMSLIEPHLQHETIKPELLIEYSHAAIKTEAAEQAYPLLKQYLDQTPEHVEVRYCMNLVCTQTGRFLEAVEYMPMDNVS